MRAGDLIRVERLVDGDGRSIPSYVGKLCVLTDTTSGGEWWVQMLEPSGGEDGAWQWVPSMGDRGSIVTLDELTDEECAALARWRLSHEAG